MKKIAIIFIAGLIFAILMFYLKEIKGLKFFCKSENDGGLKIYCNKEIK